jgi:hypothetical protein
MNVVQGPGAFLASVFSLKSALKGSLKGLLVRYNIVSPTRQLIIEEPKTLVQK